MSVNGTGSSSSGLPLTALASLLQATGNSNQTAAGTTAATPDLVSLLSGDSSGGNLGNTDDSLLALLNGDNTGTGGTNSNSDPLLSILDGEDNGSGGDPTLENLGKLELQSVQMTIYNAMGKLQSAGSTDSSASNSTVNKTG